MIGTTLGPYRLDRELGSGGMGKVYAATTTRKAAGIEAGATVALKVVHTHLVETEGFFKRFLREAEIGKSVVHENVVRTIDVDAISSGGVQQNFLVMEYVEGQTLRDLLKELDRVPEELCRHIGREIAKGLAAIHAAGAVHRDMKPENVLITKDHAVKVMDLGVARLTAEAMRLSQTGAFVGSLHYAAPESFREGGRHVDGRADLHALGLVLYELACGTNPYFAESVPETLKKVLHEEPRRLGDVNPQLSPFFEEVVHCLLAKEPAARITDAAALVRVLDDCEKSEWWRARAKAIRAETRQPLRRIRIPRETAVYGRESEIAKLRALFEKAKSGDGQVVVLEGEAGIGKSRLVDELVGRLQHAGEEIDFLFGSYPPGGAANAAGALSTAIREHVGDGGVGGYLTQTPLLVPAFEALLRGDATPTGAVPLTRESAATCFVQMLRAFAAERPTVLLVDDLHFASDDSRAMFTALALAAPGHRLLVVGTTRPGIDEKWVAGLTRLPQTTQVTVGRLGAKDLAQLLADSFHSAELASRLGHQIALKSDGNPFFAFEIIRGLREGQFITQTRDGTWVSTGVIDDIKIPSSVLDLVNARVADLSEDERNLLDVASCWGFEFDPGLVGDVVGLARIPALRAFAQIERSHRLVRAAGRAMLFDHHQVQEALYGGLLEQLREEYHAALASALEARVHATARKPEELDGAVCVDLCEHLLKGAQGARALRYLVAARTHLEKGYLYGQVVALTRRALAVPGLLAGAARADALLVVAGRLEILGRTAEQRAAVDEAVALADAGQDVGLRGRAHRLRGHFLERTFEHDAAAAELELGRELARQAGDRKTEADAMSCAALVLSNKGHHAEAEETFRRLVAEWQGLGGGVEQHAAGNLGNVLARLGRNSEALAQYERQLALAREAGDPIGETRGLTGIGNIHAVEGRHLEAIAQHERSLGVARDIGDRHGEALAVGNIGTALRSLGRFAEGQALLERHLALSQELGDRSGESRAAGNLGLLLLSVGRSAEALALFERQLSIIRETGERLSEAICRVNLGPVRLQLGDVAGAREHLDASLALCRAIRAPYPEGYARSGLAMVADEEGDSVAALRFSEEALAVRRRIGHADGVAYSLAQTAELRLRTGDVERARADVDEALKLAREQGFQAEIVECLVLLATLGGDAKAAAAALAEAGTAVRVDDVVRLRFALFKATNDRAQLAEARRQLDFLVEHAPPDRRGPMLANIRLHRAIMTACREEGIA